MLVTPLSKLNISCSCGECITFLRPFPKNSPPIQLPPDLRPSTPGPRFSLPPTPAATPIPTRKGTPHTTPHVCPTASTLAPSPAFLLTSGNSQKSGKGGSGPLALPSLSLSPSPISSLISERVNFASRSLWAHISSPIDECKTPLSAKTPGLASCAQELCVGKVVPGFGRTVCDACEEELRGAVLGLMAVMEDDDLANQNQRKGCVRAKLSRADSGVALESSRTVADGVFNQQAMKSGETEEIDKEPTLFAVPSTPPSTKLLITHSRTKSLTSRLHQSAEEGEPKPTLFALPDTSLDKSFEEFTPTTPTSKYAQDFPALPRNSRAEESKIPSVEASKRSNKGVEGLARSLSKDGSRKESMTETQTGSKTTCRRNSRARQHGPGAQHRSCNTREH